jgi:hypothetical protein
VKQGLFFVSEVFVPLTNEQVLSGRCLSCNPLNTKTADRLSDDSSTIEDADDVVCKRLSDKKSVQHAATPKDVNISIQDSFFANPSSSPRAAQYNSENSQSFAGKKFRIGLLVIVFVIIGVTLYVVFKRQHTKEISPIEQGIEANVLSRGVKFSELPKMDSRNLALDWLLHNYQNQTIADYAVYQRFILAMVAFGAGPNFRYEVDWLSEQDECTWDGVLCNEEGNVIKLELGEYYTCVHLV